MLIFYIFNFEAVLNLQRSCKNTKKNSHPKTSLGFANCASNVLQRPRVAPACHVPLVSFNLEQLVSLCFAFTTLMFLKIISGYFIECPPIWVSVMQSHK